jgi:hypothetical protein
LNYVIENNGVPKVNFKGFITNNARANWNVVKKIYGDKDPICPWFVLNAHAFSIGH